MHSYPLLLNKLHKFINAVVEPPELLHPVNIFITNNCLIIDFDLGELQ